MTKEQEVHSEGALEDTQEMRTTQPNAFYQGEVQFEKQSAIRFKSIVINSSFSNHFVEGRQFDGC